MAAVYAYIGRMLVARPTTHDVTRRALMAFASWWWLLALNIFLGGTIYAAAGFGYTSLPIQMTWAHVERLLLAASLFGLVFYLVYMLWGRTYSVAIGAFYILYYALLVYTLAQSEPTGVYVGHWRTDLTYASGTVPVLQALNGVLLLGPPVGLCLVGIVVAARGHNLETLQRFRLGIVCGALLAWWVVAVVAGQRESLGNESFQFVNRFFGLATAFVILVAYRPPKRLQKRLGVTVGLVA